MSLTPKLKLKTSLPTAPTKVGTQSTAVKKPKAKKMADPFGKPSLFFKSEDEPHKKSSIEKLAKFLRAKSAKRKKSVESET